MTQEEKVLILKDLCGRLPYGLFVSHQHDISPVKHSVLAINNSNGIRIRGLNSGSECEMWVGLNSIKPYLRPMDSMTEEEYEDFRRTFKWFERFDEPVFEWTYKSYDWLNTHHFDYRGLIPMGLALEAPEGMYELEERKALPSFCDDCGCEHP